MLLVLQRIKTYFKFKFDGKLKLATLNKTLSTLSPAISEFSVPLLIKYFLHIWGWPDKSENNESPIINILDLLLFTRKSCLRNWLYHPSLPIVGVGGNDVSDEFILQFIGQKIILHMVGIHITFSIAPAIMKISLSLLMFYSCKVYMFEKENKFPFEPWYPQKMKIKGFGEQNYRALLWQLKFKERRDTRTGRFSYESFSYVL